LPSRRGLLWWLSFLLPTVAHHRFDETDDVHIDGAHNHPRTVMIVAILDDETPWRGRHLK
jgi:hypothetical protein